MGEVKNKKEMTTVVERSKISSNWQSFLNNNTESKSATKKPNKSRQSDTYDRLIENIERKKTHIPKANVAPTKENNKCANPGGNANGPTLTQYIAMDCEMVGIGDNARDHMLARVSLVNKFGDCVYDTFVQPRETVTDYRTPVSGVRKEDIANGLPFETVQKQVADILKGRILVGHSLKNDIAVLFLSHPSLKIRDTAKYPPFRKITNGSTPSLKRLSLDLLGVDIQSGEHSSIEDARAAMQIYCLHSRQWEDSLAKTKSRKRGSRNLKMRQPLSIS